MNKRNFKIAPMARTAYRLRSNLERQPLVLVGLMGAGKTTIGKRLAMILQLPFYDADHEIEKAAQMTISELFQTYGEAEFRALERRVITRLLTEGPMVLATGGGAFMNEEIRAAIAEHGISIWLNAEIDVLMERVSRRQTRPLLKNDNPRAVMQKLMEERYPVYATADFTVMSRKARRNVIVRDIIKLVDRYLVNLTTNAEAEKNDTGHC